MQPQIMQVMKTATQLQAMKSTLTLTIMATTRLEKVETATINVKDDNSVTQIVMQMKYPTIQSAPQAITIQSVLKSIEKCTSKSDLDLLQIDFYITFDLQITHNDPIDSPEQIEVKENIQEKESNTRKISKISKKKQKRNLKLFVNVFESIESFVIFTFFKLGLIIIKSIFFISFMIFEFILIFE